MRKTNSTNYRNQFAVRYRCPLAQTLDLVSGRWKPVILWRLIAEKQTYGQLKKELVGISEPILAKQLRELIADGLLTKHILSTSPPRTEYDLSEVGTALKPLLQELSAWGMKYKENGQVHP